MSMRRRARAGNHENQISDWANFGARRMIDRSHPHHLPKTSTESRKKEQEELGHFGVDLESGAGGGAPCLSATTRPQP